MSAFSELVLGFIAPVRCLGCDTPSAGPFCAECSPPIPFVRGPPCIAGVPVLVAGEYAGALAQGIRRLKYEGRPDLAKPLARLLVPVARRARAGRLTLVPVPLHAGRLAERGFNQSALVARELAGALGTRVLPRALERLRDTGHQAQLDRKARRNNLEAAFRLRTSLPPGARVALLDDVITTGSTAEACIRAVEAGGASVSLVLALAAKR